MGYDVLLALHVNKQIDKLAWPIARRRENGPFQVPKSALTWLSISMPMPVWSKTKPGERASNNGAPIPGYL